MKAQLGLILASLEYYEFQFLISYFIIAAMAYKYWVKVYTPVVTVAIFMAATLSVSAYILTIVFYLLYPNYFDHGQALVASISWLWMHGHELYPDWTAREIYGSVYGPILFLINGAPLQLYPSIFSSKVPGIISLAVSLGALFTILRQQTASNFMSFILVASLMMLLGIFNAYSYWNRPEPFLILVSVLALVMARSSPLLLAVIGIGVLAGVATGLKLYGFVYLVPCMAATLARVDSLRDRLVIGTVSSFFALSFLLVPYLENGASIADHVRILSVESGHGWSVSLFIENLLFAFVLTVPIVAIRILSKPALDPPVRWFIAALLLSIAMTAVIGAKRGGGTYYFLPFIPLCTYGIAAVCPSDKNEAKQIAALIFVSTFLAYSPHLLLFMRKIYSYQIATQSELEKISELKSYINSYPEAQIGVSDNLHYPDYFYRVILGWNGRALQVDFTTWMELEYAGVDEAHIVKFINGCRVPAWILPLGVPFTLLSFYDNTPVLSDNFRQIFNRNYKQVEEGHAYQVWKCKTPAIE